MLRAILSVIAGYVAMFLTVFLTFSAAYLAMGTERAFQTRTYEVGALWIVVSIVLGLVAAVLGGWLCAFISRSRKAVLALAGAVLLLGLLMLFPVMQANQQASPPRTAGVGNFEAMRKVRQPTWIALVSPILGCMGVLVGGRLRQGQSPKPVA